MSVSFQKELARLLLPVVCHMKGEFLFMEISVWDLIIIGVYLIVMVLVGVYSVKRIKNTGDYYVAGRSFGPLVLMATVCATIIGGSGLMGRAGVAYSDGFKAILTALPYLLGMFIFSGFAGKISDLGMKYNLTSIPDLFDRRFGKAAKLILSVLTMKQAR